MGLENRITDSPHGGGTEKTEFSHKTPRKRLKGNNIARAVRSTALVASILAGISACDTAPKDKKDTHKTEDAASAPASSEKIPEHELDIPDIQDTVDTVQLQKNIEDALTKEIEKSIKGKEEFDLDHSILGLGDKTIRGKSLPERLFSPRFSLQYLSFMNHNGSAINSAIRRGIGLDRKFTTRTDNMSRRGARPMTLREMALWELANIDTVQHDFEWLELNAIILLKAGSTPIIRLDKEEKELSLDELNAFNEEEFDIEWNPEALSKEQRRRYEMIYGDKGTCDSLHALQALTAYSFYKNDTESQKKHLDFVVSTLKEELQDAQHNVDKVMQEHHEYDEDSARQVKLMKLHGDRIHSISHLLSVITEFPDDYQFTPSQRKVIHLGFVLMKQDVSEVLKLEYGGFGSLAHAVDVISTLSTTLQRGESPVSQSGQTTASLSQ